jgi:hypothetical protein
MTDLTHVWVVESLGDDTPTLLSVHTDQQTARAAVYDYIAHPHFGGTEADYWVHTMKLNWTGVPRGE